MLLSQHKNQQLYETIRNKDLIAFRGLVTPDEKFFK
jgi:hypothetical protein